MLYKNILVLLAMVVFFAGNALQAGREEMAPLTIVNVSSHPLDMTILGERISLEPGEKTTINKALRTNVVVDVHNPINIPGLQFHHTQRTKITWDGVQWTRTYQDWWPE